MPIIVAGSRSVPATGGALALATSSQPCFAVHIGATGIVFVGDADSQELPVPAGESVRIAVNDVQKVYAVPAAGTLTIGWVAEKT
jgi:hypothetical protein